VFQPVITFEVVQGKNAKGHLVDGWAVRRTDADGFQIVVTRTFDNMQEAANEATRLNREVGPKLMG
jgi:hypothetical protein